MEKVLEGSKDDLKTLKPLDIRAKGE